MLTVLGEAVVDLLPNGADGSFRPTSAAAH